MAINIVHVVTDLSQINFGIWNAALFGSDFLKLIGEINSCVVVGENGNTNSAKVNIPIIWAGASPSKEKVIEDLAAIGFTKSETIVVTHGCWKMPTRLGSQLKESGFKWIYTPHGMLEPWSLANHRLKKMVYFHLFEKRYFRKADAVRAVSKAEQTNLHHLLKRKIQVVENGVNMQEMPGKTGAATLQFVFMARLHFKKGIVPLVKAWSHTMKERNAQLTIAGPDEGELDKIKPYLKDNIRYAGPAYGEEKKELLKQSHYYLLPSYSEGFPTSVVEAMSYGAIPLISKGCNFPEVFENKLGYPVEPDEESIATVLDSLKDKPFDHSLSERNHHFIKEHYSEEAIGHKLQLMYKDLFNEIGDR